MMRWMLGTAIEWRSLLVASLLISQVTAKGDSPKVTMKNFDHAPMNLQYFDDSDVVMFQDWATNSVWRSDNAGETWNKVDGPIDGEEWNMVMHPFDHTRAYIMTEGSDHWMTKDRGATWQNFFTDAAPSVWRLPALSFHAGDPDRIIFNAQDCSGIFCEELAMYTTDGFQNTKFLRSDTAGCYWAKTTSEFTTGQEDLDRNRILCISKGKFSWFAKDDRLVISDNFFSANDGAIQEFEPDLETSRTVTGVAKMAVVKGYLVAASMAERTDEMALYVSDDTVKWHRAIFPKDHRLDENGYTILESTKYSIQIDVMNTRNLNPMGVLLSSNSNGTYFTRLAEHTNRGSDGLVDFEKMSGVQGIILLNIVDNWKEVEESLFEPKKVISQISFDDGRTWQPLKADGKDLHLHSVTDRTNSGRVFSSPAPGIVMGVGNTGDHLKGYAEGDTYVSDDAGVTWKKALDGPHKYEFGDSGSILLAIPDNGKLTDTIEYSLKHGQPDSWQTVALPEKIIPLILTTTMDSTSLKFILIGTDDKERQSDFRVISIDFNDMHEGQCKESDLEKWWARVDDKGDPTCLMGQRQYYKRRKADADCFIKAEFKDPEPQSESCECAVTDFECDFNFVRSPDREECIKPAGIPYIIPEGACVAFDSDTTFLGSSGWRKIPGNKCERTDGKQKDDPVPRKCAESAGKPADGKITSAQTPFDAKYFAERIYLERTETSTGDDETIVMLTSRSEVWISQDSGKSWEQILKDAHIERIIRHPNFNDVVYFIADNKKVHYSMNRGENIRYFDAPSLPDPQYNMMNFHPTHKDWIIWTGVKDCDGGAGSSGDCHGVASITTDRGDNWKTLQRYVRKCEFIKDNPPQRRDEKLVYCDKRKRESNSDENNPWQLVSSSDFFEEDNEIKYDDIVDFATMSEFIVVAVKDENQELKAAASVDGSTFAEALFPPNFWVSHQSAYTVMDSSTHSVFLHVTVENQVGAEYGSIIKSNSNGTSYVLSLSGVNRDREGYVDFEKMSGLEGVALVNVVNNYKSVVADGVKNKKTMITHNDGAEWALLPPPAKDSEGNDFGCSGGLDRCSLHVHAFTERTDKTRTFSSPSAVGLMMAVGNVGEFLGPYSTSDTFMTTDAGITWKFVKKGSYMWEYGDQGSIIVLVRDTAPTRSIYYSRNEGASWEEYIFADEDVEVLDITTVPSDNSRNFVLWVETEGSKMSTINIDFSGLTDRQCVLDETTENADYYLWSPQHPKQKNNCIFGHVEQYHRKRIDADCFNGRKIQHLHNIAKDCECARQDFECDYNYEPNSDGTCHLVDGLSPADHSKVCELDPDLLVYYDPTGYRRIPLSTCEGGRDLEAAGTPHPCPGKEALWDEKHRISTAGLFFAIVIPIVVAAAAGWYVWEKWAKGWGQIRLGEQSNFSWDEDSAFVKYPVVAISAIVAVAITLPSLLGSAWREISKVFVRPRQARYTTRRSFAREQDYAAVDEDEGELLGEESDEEA